MEENPQDCYKEAREALQEYCRDIEFDVFIYYYLKGIDDKDPFAARLRKYIELGSKKKKMTPNEFFINMLKRAINGDIMDTDLYKRRIQFTSEGFIRPAYRSPYLPKK